MNDRLELRGIIPAVVTPWTREDALDEPVLRRYARWVLGHEGLGGVAVNMDTGEGPHLTSAERVRILHVWREENAGDVPLLAGLNARYTAEAVEQAREAEAAGADALVVFPIPAFVGSPLDPEVPYRYHKAIADAVPLPMVLFQLQPALAGVLFTPETLARLVAIDHVVAIKEASFDALTFVRTARLLERLDRRITLLTGNDNFIYESFVLGAQGALVGFGTLAVAEQIALVRAALEGDHRRAATLWEQVRPLEEAIFAPPVRDYRARTKAALQAIGVLDNALMRPPLLPVAEDEATKIGALMQPWAGAR